MGLCNGKKDDNTEKTPTGLVAVVEVSELSTPVSVHTGTDSIGVATTGDITIEVEEDDVVTESVGTASRWTTRSCEISMEVLLRMKVKCLVDRLVTLQ
jgi:hypothetical protein